MSILRLGGTFHGQQRLPFDSYKLYIIVTYFSYYCPPLPQAGTTLVLFFKDRNVRHLLLCYRPWDKEGQIIVVNDRYTVNINYLSPYNQNIFIYYINNVH